MQLSHKIVLTLSLGFVFFSMLVISSYGESEESNTPKNCEIKEYGASWGMGSWKISVEKIESGLCYMVIYSEIEQGWDTSICQIPINEVGYYFKTTDWPNQQFENKEYDLKTHCTLLSSGSWHDITDIYVSPHLQLTMGISPKNIQCPDRAPILMQKFSTNSPSCVRFSTSERLVTLDWGTILRNDLTVISYVEKPGDCKGPSGCFVGKITDVIDGNTIEVNGDRIGLSLISTGLADDATTKKSIVKYCPINGQVTIDEDDGQSSERQGRIMAKVFCSYNLILLNSVLLDEGMAVIDKQSCPTSEFATENWARKYGC